MKDEKQNKCHKDVDTSILFRLIYFIFLRKFYRIYRILHYELYQKNKFLKHHHQTFEIMLSDINCIKLVSVD